MPRIAITGHINLTPQTVPLIYRAIAERLALYPAGELVGISCIASGADSVFATAVLDVGGVLEVVLPCMDYRETQVLPEHAPQFDSLLARASNVYTLPLQQANRHAFEAANTVMLAECDELFAVWDGHSGRSITAAVAELAASRGLPVQVIWPEGATRG